MKKLFVVLAVLLVAVPLIAGCGQNQQGDNAGKPIVVKSDPPVETNMDEDITEEEAEVEEVVSEETIPAAVTVPEAEKAQIAEVVAAPKVDLPKPMEIVVLADFNSGEKPSNVGGNFGGWNKDPSDPTQWCKESFDNITRHGDTGFAIKLDYSVDSPNPAYNGFWMLLPNFDASKYDTLRFWVKGDLKAGYTTVFKIELKNADRQLGRYYASNVSDQWQEVSIPLSEFKGLINKSNLTEFVVVFEDRMATNKKGVIYIDDISFTKG